MITVDVPGKLFLMGEFAAMKPGNTSVIAAIDRVMTFHITAAPELSVTSYFGSLDRRDMFHDTGPMRYVSAALAVVHAYTGCDDAYALSITSQLDSESGAKYGFGSSGVVIVGVIKAVLAYYKHDVTPLVVFKLAVLAQRRMAEYSSGGDLAAAVWGGVVSYTRYDLKWLNTQDSDARTLVNTQWPLLAVKPLDYSWYDIGVGWTQIVNRTAPYLKYYERWYKTHETEAMRFEHGAQRAVSRFITASETHDFPALSQAVNAYRALMLDLEQSLALEIEIPRLRALIDSAQMFGYPAKISGSGGGDCGVFFGLSKNSENLKKLSNEWLKHGILMLDVEVFLK